MALSLPFTVNFLINCILGIFFPIAIGFIIGPMFAWPLLNLSRVVGRHWYPGAIDAQQAYTTFITSGSVAAVSSFFRNQTTLKSKRNGMYPVFITNGINRVF